jgi:asparagine N-glycosylation enzyme membrane subunit Stt3
MKTPALQSRRTGIRYVSPRFQGPAVLAFAAIIAAGGAIFWKLVDSEFQRVFLHVAIRGHYAFDSAYDIVRDLLAWHLAGLFVGIFLTGSVLVLLLVAATRHGIGKAVDSLRASADGVLSTSTGTGSISEFGRFGEKIDAARSETFASVLKIRSEAAALAGGGISPEEFRLRWDELKHRIRRIAP